MPLRPNVLYEGWEEFRKQHLDAVRAVGGTHKDIQEIQARWDYEDHERACYKAYREDKKQYVKHSRYQEWVNETEPAWYNNKAPIPPLFEVWLEGKKHEEKFKTNLLVASDSVITYEHPIGVNLEVLNNRILALVEKRVDLFDYEKVLGIKILKIDKPEHDETGIAQGHITHLVSTPIGIITYAYKPTIKNLPDIFFEAEADKALLKILKNNPEANLQLHQQFLRITIVRIDPKKRTIGFGPPVGDSR